MTEFTMGQDVPEPPKAADPNVGKNKAILNYIMKSLRATKPWTRLLSILGFIGTGLSILVGLGLMVGGNLIPISPKAPPLVYLGIFYILTSVFCLVPSIWLSKYSSAIASFLKGGDSVQLGKALAYQKSFWKFVGILVLVFIAIAILGILAAILIPAFLVFRG
ncbi:MAG: hypothetical protein KAI93_13485 [Desulfobacterales bacterium]|nr:hypothetical protein [Desulfobacterales bacterium]